MRARTLFRLSTTAGFLVIAILVAFEQIAAGASSTLVISQIYGGGGNQGATLTNDFIELLNRGGTPIDVSGWTVQYASANGSDWQRTMLAGTIQPGQYYLIEESRGNAGSVSLPTPDAAGGIALSAMSGKVALVSDSMLLFGATPSGPHIIDFVGYGSADFAEDRATGELTNITAAIRRSGAAPRPITTRRTLKSRRPIHAIAAQDSTCAQFQIQRPRFPKLELPTRPPSLPARSHRAKSLPSLAPAWVRLP